MTEPDFIPNAVLDVLHCTPEDLAANRRGQLSTRQYAMLPDLAQEQQFDARREAFCSAITLGGCTSFFAFAGVAGLIDAVQQDVFLVRAVGIPVSLVTVLLALLGYRYVLRSLRWAIGHTEPACNLRQDLTARIVRHVTGPVVYRDGQDDHDAHRDQDHTPEVLHIGTEAFECHAALREALPEGAHVTAYYTPYRRVLVAIEPTDPSP